MAISRRLRFEILRRDGYTCRYCGAKAPDVTLEVDHVVAVALGGSDEASNLVTACEDCNRGKSSVPADAEIVEDVAADALRWKAAIEQAGVELRAEREVLRDLCERFRMAWEPPAPAEDPAVESPGPPDPWIGMVGPAMARHSCIVSVEGTVLLVAVDGPAWATQIRGLSKALIERAADHLDKPVEGVKVVVRQGATTEGASSSYDSLPPTPPRLPDDWQTTIERFLAIGLDIDSLIRLARVSLDKSSIAHSAKWRYFCGCAWREVTTLQESARRILEAKGE